MFKAIFSIPYGVYLCLSLYFLINRLLCSYKRNRGAGAEYPFGYLVICTSLFFMFLGLMLGSINQKLPVSWLILEISSVILPFGALFVSAMQLIEWLHRCVKKTRGEKLPLERRNKIGINVLFPIQAAFGYVFLFSALGSKEELWSKLLMWAGFVIGVFCFDALSIRKTYTTKTQEKAAIRPYNDSCNDDEGA